MRILSLKVLLLHHELLCLHCMVFLLLDRGRPLLVCTVFAWSIATDLTFMVLARSSHFQMIQLFVQHHRLLHDRKIQTLAFLRFEILKPLILPLTLAFLCDVFESHFFSLSVISDFHELLSTLSLTFDAIEHSLFVSLQNVESRFQWLQHAWILIFDPLSQYKWVKSTWISTMSQEAASLVEGTCWTHVICNGIPVELLSTIPRWTLFFFSEFIKVSFFLLLVSRVWYWFWLLLVIEQYLFAIVTNFSLI